MLPELSGSSRRNLLGRTLGNEMEGPPLPCGGSPVFVAARRQGAPDLSPVRARRARLPGGALPLLLCLAPSLLGQSSFYDPEYSASNWQTEQGLPENSATTMIQTPEGYLLFGTFQGLVRFDGAKFTLFHHPGSKALPDLGIVKTFVDRAESLWVSTLGGMALHRDGKWEHFGKDQGWAGVARHFAEAPDGSIFVSAFDHRIRRFHSGRFSELPAPAGRIDPTIVFSDPQGHVHAVNRDTFNTWNGKGWDSVQQPAEIRNQPHLPAWGTSRDGLLWASSGSALLLLDHGRIARRIALSTRPSHAWNLIEDPQGQVWICSYRSGLYRVSPGGRMRHFSTATGFPSDSVRFVFPDSQGNLWVGTDGGGLVRLRERRFFSISSENGLPRFPVKAVAPHPDGSTLIATSGGGAYRIRDGRVAPLPLPHPADYTQSLLIDSHLRTWVGTYGSGLLLFDSHNSGSALPQSISGSSVEGLFEDSRGRVWIAGSSGRISSNEGDRFSSFTIDRNSGGVPIRCFAEDRHCGAIFAGGDAGLFTLQGSRFVSVLDPSGQPFPPVTFIHPDGRNNLWIATSTRGLLRWQDGALAQVDSELLPTGIIGGILEDGDHFWLAGNRGVFRVGRKDLNSAVTQSGNRKLEWQYFSRGDGLPSIECSIDHQPSMGRDAAGRIWVSTLRGAAVIDPRRLKLNSDDVPVRIEEVAYLSRQGDQKRLRVIGSPSVRIPPGSINLQVAYTALELADPDKVLFAYELKQGRTVVASGLRATRDLSFPLLEAGEYRLSIQARNGDGFWSRNTAEIQISLDPFIWNTAAFRFSLALFSAIVIAWGAISIARIRSRQVLERLAREKEHAELENRLLQAGKMESIGRLAGGVAHDFNNLLTIVNGYAQILLDDIPPGSPLRPRLEGIHGAGQRAADLTRQLLAFSRKQPISLKPLHLNHIVRDFTSILQRLVGDRTRIELDLDDSLGLVNADPGQMGQLLMNMVVNARDAMPQGGSIFIETANRSLSSANCLENSAAHPGHWVLLSISDTGTGMDEQTRSRIFEPFFTTKAPGEGTGMGLSIAYGAVKQSGGWIEVDSAPGRGTRFRVYLPRLGALPASEPEQASLFDSPCETILLVEDQPDVRRLTAEVLRIGGYNVLQAAGGTEALALASSHSNSINLLLSDVVMPGLSGYEIAERLAIRIPRLKVMFMSGYAGNSADAPFVSKPFDPAALLQCVRTVLRGE